MDMSGRLSETPLQESSGILRYTLTTANSGEPR